MLSTGCDAGVLKGGLSRQSHPYVYHRFSVKRMKIVSGAVESFVAEVKEGMFPSESESY